MMAPMVYENRVSEDGVLRWFGHLIPIWKTARPSINRDLAGRTILLSADRYSSAKHSALSGLRLQALAHGYLRFKDRSTRWKGRSNFIGSQEIRRSRSPRFLLFLSPESTCDKEVATVRAVVLPVFHSRFGFERKISAID